MMVHNLFWKGIIIMQIIEGKGVFGGIAIGYAKEFSKTRDKVKRFKIDDPEKEIERVKKACKIADKQLEKLYLDAVNEVGEGNAEIFNIHRMMLEDRDYLESIENIIETELINAEYAVAVTGDNFSKMFLSMEDDYMRERADDVHDITDRIIKAMSNNDEEPFLDEPSVIFASDLLPSQTIKFDKSKVLAFVTKKGSVNSHTAILARTMNIPAVVGVGEYPQNIENSLIIVDGFEGKIYIDPDEKTKNALSERKKIDEEKKLLLENFRGVESKTLDGKKINVYANIGGLKDVLYVLSNDADGIGLFRSEFLYLENKTYPTEEEQLETYITVARNMAGKKVIIRTLDIGADKNVDYFKIDKEENPAMGYRAIRICLDREDIFKTQLRAILRASAYGNISVMIPMVVSLDEVVKAKEILNDVKRELEESNIPYKKNIEFGIMIETPAAVVISDKLAKEVDFFSIGTNDLTQYMLACDRQNPKVEYLCEEPHLSVLRIIKIAVDNAKREGIWVGICGELASDLNLIEYFLALGIDELSVSASNVLAVRKKITESDISVLQNKALKLIE